MLGGAQVRKIIELHAAGHSIRNISKQTGIARNSIRKYLRAEGLPEKKTGKVRFKKIEPYRDYLQSRLADGVDNAVVLLRELKAQGYQGGYTALKEYLHPGRSQKQKNERPTMRFETEMGQQAQVDFGKYAYLDPSGQVRHVWAFVMVLGWSRALYVEFILKADTSAFLRCHLNAFDAFGGVPHTCLYDNTKLVVLERDDQGEPVWNSLFLDFALQAGFVAHLCQPYRPRTKGKVERGVGYVEGNFWTGGKFTDLADLNQQGQVWLDTVANIRVHGTTREKPCDRLVLERPHLRPLPVRERLRPFMVQSRKVGWDAFVAVSGAYYGVPSEVCGQWVDVEVTFSELNDPALKVQGFGCD
jgi:transposase